MLCETCEFWGHKKCIIPCFNATPKNFQIRGLVLEPSTTNKLRRDSKGIYIPLENAKFREFCEATGKLGLLDLFSLTVLGKSMEDLNGNSLDLNLRNRELLAVPDHWSEQFRAVEKHYRALAVNGIDRGLTYARKITRTLHERQKLNKVVLIYFWNVHKE